MNKTVCGYRNNSKGNQLKWKDGDIWYKADYLGYEALSETLVSRLLEKSNAEQFVKYQMERVSYSDSDSFNKKFTCCKSTHFLREDESEITLPELFRRFKNIEIEDEIENPLLDEIGCIKLIVDGVEEITGIQDFGTYFTKLIEIDAFFLNEDRHLKNISVIYNNKTSEFRLCPYFDFGASLFSDTLLAYDLDFSLDYCYSKVRGKPISPSFEDQVSACEGLYGPQLALWFTREDIENVLAEVSPYYDDERLLSRLETVLEKQTKDYKKFFECAKTLKI